MHYWNELRVAYLIAVHGTATAVARELGVHRTTVLRNLDFLEKELRQKLFIRHNKGFTINENGKILLKSFDDINKNISMAIHEVTAQESSLTGELIITSVERGFSFIREPIQAFLMAHPKVYIRFLADIKTKRLEYGDAHIALKPGPEPTEPDYVVSRFCDIKLGIYASKSYIAKYGKPKNESDFGQHKFVIAALPVKNSVNDWLDRFVKPENVSLLSDEPSIIEEAVISGIGIGMVMRQHAIKHIDLVELLPSRQEWNIPLWLVTHGDQHRVPKVHACTRFLKSWAKKMI